MPEPASNYFTNALNKRESTRREFEATLPRDPESFMSWVQFDDLNRILKLLRRKAIPKKPIDEDEHSDDAKKKSEKNLVDRDNVSFLQNFENNTDLVDNPDREKIVAYARDQHVYINLDALFPGRNASEAVLAMLHILLHELLHVASSSDLTYEHVHDLKRIITTERSGFLEVKSSDITPVLKEEKGRALNEAVTEMITLEVLKYYLNETGNNALLRNSSPNMLVLHGQGSYRNERVALSLLTYALSKRLHVSEDHITQAFVREYFAHEINNSDFTELLQEALNSLYDIDDSLERDSVIKTVMKSRYVPDADEESAKKLLIPNSKERTAVMSRIVSRMYNWDTIDALANALRLS